MAKSLVKKGVVKRQKGFMYFIDGKGDLWKAKMAGRRKKK